MVKKIINTKAKTGFLYTFLLYKKEIQVFLRNWSSNTTITKIYTISIPIKDSIFENFEAKKLKILLLLYAKNFKVLEKSEKNQKKN